MNGPVQSALHPAGPHAAEIAGLWWMFFWVCAVALALVLVALIVALLRRRRAPDQEPPLLEDPPREVRRLAVWVGAAGGATVVALIVLLIASAVSGHRLARMPSHDALSVQVTGNRFWWEVTYQHSDPSKTVITANELHIPVGRTVVLQLRSRDVVHSLWIPSFAGKRDLIPGQETFLTIQADRAGRFRGQCAEFCGYQHAKMAIWVVAEDPAAFEAWLAHQREPAPEPVAPDAIHGRALFVGGACAMCHTVGGTTSQATVAPNLTHFAGRASLAAGASPMSRDHLRAWLADPQALKPGNNMPKVQLSPGDLEDVVAYLESLK
jgi:cytochrome c oxidase subunit II